MRDIIPHLIPGTTQKLTLGAAAATSTAVGNATYMVRLASDQDFFFEIGPSPTAVATTSPYMPATHEGVLFAINPGEQVSVIQNATAGFVTVTEVSQ